MYNMIIHKFKELIHLTVRAGKSEVCSSETQAGLYAA